MKRLIIVAVSVISMLGIGGGVASAGVVIPPKPPCTIPGHCPV